MSHVQPAASGGFVYRADRSPTRGVTNTPAVSRAAAGAFACNELTAALGQQVSLLAVLCQRAHSNTA
jgi:hypothetical protein